LSKDKSAKWLDYTVFKMHSLSSEHSTNWFLVLLWIIFIGIVTSIAIKASTISISLISVESYQKISEKPLWYMPVIFLNKVSLGYLYYQFLMSVRKDTRK